MDQPRLTRKPIPSTPLEWIKEVEGVRGYLHRIDTEITDRPPNWVEGNRAYYERRFLDLIRNPPDGIRVRGQQYTRIWSS